MHPAKTDLHNSTHIVGVLIQTQPENIPQVRADLSDIAGLEIHAVSPDGRIVVTIEGDGRRSVADALTSLNTIERVLSTCLVYEHSETDPIALPTEMSHEAQQT